MGGCIMDLIEMYEQNGIKDMRLRNIVDLQNIYNINAEDIHGYKILSDNNKELFKHFIVNFFNRQGIERKFKINPQKISFTGRRLKFEFLIGCNPEYYYIINENEWG
jgi:hypothetical protein